MRAHTANRKKEEEMKLDDQQREKLTDRIIDVLHTVYDPEIPVDVYELGLIYEIEVSENADVKIVMTMTTPNCPMIESLPEEIEQKYGMSRVAIRSHVYRNNIPSKKEHGQIFYSKLHFDLSKQTAEDNASEYYTVQEAMKRYNLTRDSVYGILQFHEIKREKKGRFVRFLKVEFDHVMGARK